MCSLKFERFVCQPDGGTGDFPKIGMFPSAFVLVPTTWCLRDEHFSAGFVNLGESAALARTGMTSAIQVASKTASALIVIMLHASLWGVRTRVGPTSCQLIADA